MSIPEMDWGPLWLTMQLAAVTVGVLLVVGTPLPGRDARVLSGPRAGPVPRRHRLTEHRAADRRRALRRAGIRQPARARPSLEFRAVRAAAPQPDALV